MFAHTMGQAHRGAQDVPAIAMQDARRAAVGTAAAAEHHARLRARGDSPGRSLQRAQRATMDHFRWWFHGVREACTRKLAAAGMRCRHRHSLALTAASAATGRGDGAHELELAQHPRPHRHPSVRDCRLSGAPTV